MTTDNGRKTIIDVGKIIIGRYRQNTFFVAQNAIYKFCYASTDTVIGSAFFLDNVVSFVSGEIFNFFS